jgi:hypothetical protein
MENKKYYYSKDTDSLYTSQDKDLPDKIYEITKQQWDAIIKCMLALSDAKADCYVGRQPVEVKNGRR